MKIENIIKSANYAAERDTSNQPTLYNQIELHTAKLKQQEEFANLEKSNELNAFLDVLLSDY